MTATTEPPEIPEVGSQAAPERAGSGRGRALAFVGAVVVVALVAAGAIWALGDGGDDGGEGAASVETVDLAEVAAATEATTARGEVVQELGGGTPVTLEAEIDFQGRRAKLVGEVGATMVGSFPDEAFDDLPDELTRETRQMLDVMDAATELVIADGRAYLRADGAWWDIGATSTGAEGEVDLFSPTDIVEQLSQLGEVREVGVEDVRGEPATHYAAAKDDHWTTDVWVDGEGRLVRIDDVYEDPSDDAFSMSMSMVLFDFGAPVDIEAPAGAQDLTFTPDTPVLEGGAEPPVPGDGAEPQLEEVASGTEGDVAWRLLTGRTADGRRCVQVVTDPALDGEWVRYGDTDASSFNGVVEAGDETPPSCGPLERGDLGGSGAILLAVGGREGDVHYLTGVLDEGAEVTVTFPGGRNEVLEGHDGAFALFFTGDDWPMSMEGGVTYCELQGDSTMSGADVVC